MHRKKKICYSMAIIIHILSTLSLFANNSNFFEQLHRDMQKNFDQLHQEYQLMHQEIMSKLDKNKEYNTTQLSSPSLSIDTSSLKDIIVQVSNIGRYEGYMQHCDENDVCYGLDIKADNTIIKLHYTASSQYLEVTLMYGTEQLQGEKKNKQKIAYQKTIQQGITVSGNVDLSNPIIAYNEKQQLLTIHLHVITEEEMMTDDDLMDEE